MTDFFSKQKTPKGSFFFFFNLQSFKINDRELKQDSPTSLGTKDNPDYVEQREVDTNEIS